MVDVGVVKLVEFYSIFAAQIYLLSFRDKNAANIESNGCDIKTGPIFQPGFFRSYMQQGIRGKAMLGVSGRGVCGTFGYRCGGDG